MSIRTRRGVAPAARHGRGERGGVAAFARGTALLLGAAAALAAGSAPAAADACSECREPTLAEIAADPAFRLEERFSLLGPRSDYVETDGGECDLRFSGPPVYERLNSLMVPGGSGIVWDCPESRSCDKMVGEVEEGHTTGWTQSAEGGIGLTGDGVTLTLKVLEAISRGFHVTIVTRIEKDMCAKFCHRVPWAAYFEVVTFRATVKFTLQRRYAWWTKNQWTGADVHAKGDVWVPCGEGTLSFSRRAPIGGYFHLWDLPCQNTEGCAPVTPRDLGWHPDPTVPMPPPPVVGPDLTPPAGSDGVATGSPDGVATDGLGTDGAPRPGVEGDDDWPLVPPPAADDPDDLGPPPAGPVTVAPGFEDLIEGPLRPSTGDAETGWVEPLGTGTAR